MNKAELIVAIAEESGLAKTDAKKALEAFVNITTQTLEKGERVALVGFGSWSIKLREERKGRNPRTKEEIIIPEKKVVKFKAGSDLVAAVEK